MASRTVITYDFAVSGSVGSLATNPLNGGLYVYGVEAVFGTSSVLSVEISFDGTNFMPITDLTGTLISDTDTGAGDAYHTFHAPIGSQVKLVVATDDMVSGNAWIAEAASING